MACLEFNFMINFYDSLPVLAIVFSIVGCAQSPDKVQPLSVNPEKYYDLSCNEISKRLADIETRLDRVRQIQSKNASADVAAVAGGVLTLWSPLLFLNGESNQNHLSILKGELIALESAELNKKCK
jgi:hypothetical protein